MPPKAKSLDSTMPSKESLFEDLYNDNLFFDSVVDMIPAKLYVKGLSGDDFNPKYFKGQAKESKEARRAHNKLAKRAKLDPSQAETTTQMKRRLEEQEQRDEDEEENDHSNINKNPRSGGVSKKGHRGAGGALLPTSPASKKPGEAGKAVAAVTPDGKINGGKNGSNISRIDALRAKLHAKIAEKRGQRPTDPSVVSKRAARAAEKKKRKEEAAARKKQKATQSIAERGANDKRYVATNGNANDPATIEQDLSTVDFGLLSGLNSHKNMINGVSRESYLLTNKSLANLSKTKNLEKLIADAEAKKQRLIELQNSSNAEDQEKAANIHWGDAIKEASGDRVKDDPARLKKQLKRKIAKKTKSAKAWKTRMNQTQQKMDERQNIRTHNLNQRKIGGQSGANLSKKRIVTEETTTKETRKSRKAAAKAAGGSGGGRAGFEGKKQGFINKSSKAVPQKKGQ